MSGPTVVCPTPDCGNVWSQSRAVSAYKHRDQWNTATEEGTTIGCMECGTIFVVVADGIRPATEADIEAAELRRVSR